VFDVSYRRRRLANVNSELFSIRDCIFGNIKCGTKCLINEALARFKNVRSDLLFVVREFDI